MSHATPVGWSKGPACLTRRNAGVRRWRGCQPRLTASSLARSTSVRRHEHIHVGHGPQTRIAVEARDQGQSLEDDGIDAGLLEGPAAGKNAVVEALVLAPGEEVSLLQGIDPLVAAPRRMRFRYTSGSSDWEAPSSGSNAIEARTSAPGRHAPPRPGAAPPAAIAPAAHSADSWSHRLPSGARKWDHVSWPLARRAGICRPTRAHCRGGGNRCEREGLRTVDPRAMRRQDCP